MRNPSRREVARTPLMGRLVDLEPGLGREPHPLRTLDRGELLDSIAAELDRLLRARCHRPLAELEVSAAVDRTALDFGLPDLSSLDLARIADRQRLRTVLTRTITAFEPRLLDPRVTVDPAPPDPRVARIVLTARLVIDRHGEPVSFPLTIPLDPAPGDRDDRRP